MDRSQIADWQVLVVDDEPDSIEVVRIVLTAAGATVYEAANGNEGLKVFERERLDLVLTDLSMPEVDGWQMLESIRASEDGQQVPIIALTAHAMVGDKERVLEAGFDAYLSKPLKLFSFLDDLAVCLNGLHKSE